MPDPDGTTVAQEVELNLKSREDLDQIMTSLTRLLRWNDAGETETAGPTLQVPVGPSIDAVLESVAAPRQELVRTAFRLLELNRLSVSHVPGADTEPYLFPTLLALYTLENIAKKPMTIKRLTTLVGIPQTTMLRLLERMERRNMIRRESVPDDGRMVALELTDDTRGLLDVFFRTAGKSLRDEGVS